MTSTEDLVRELHAQADATRSWPAPVLPHRRTPQRPSRLRATAIVLATAVAVVLAVVAVPRLLDHHEQTAIAPAIRSLTPSDLASQRGADRRAADAARRASQEMARIARQAARAQAWRTTRCGPVAWGGCAIPAELELDGKHYTSVTGGQAPTYAHGRLSNVSLRLSPDKLRGATHVLVGATGSTSRSELQVAFGGLPPISLSPGRLSLVLMPRGPDRGQVRVTEHGRPVPRETLTIQEYSPVR